ncbi:hypothetical protein ABT174_01615 [Streptomyces sparsogenes]|uniref:hypothetical protein n=1 Tax=Streptomyces sparsogenes TaxID=67365 RepID=UPI003330F56C
MTEASDTAHRREPSSENTPSDGNPAASDTLFSTMKNVVIARLETQPCRAGGDHEWNI